MRILVTGAAGFIGSHLAERLAGEGHDVRAVDCLTDNYAPVLKELNVHALSDAGCAFFRRDLAQDVLVDLLHDVDVIFHLAAQPGLSAATPFEAYVRNNIMATQRLLQAAAETPALRTFIHVSTSSVYGARATGDESAEPKPTSYYGVTKLAAEQLVMAASREHGLPACSLRLFSVYGPRERPEKLYPRLIGCLLEEREFPLFEGSEEHYRSYTYVGDIVAGMLAALENMPRCRGEVINIGADRAITTGEGMRIVEELVGRKAKIALQPRRVGDQLETRANIEKARRVLGYKPTTSAREGLAREVDWYREQILGKVEV
ncbi:MAG TPA: NAD-dependent epimerase/dehydratase family protein [Anaerolineales bacterium]|jgi:nucleoside-diphosphate-sugar epimerase|nr:NAD-dependent epimerase/dehydratase family protein [Anaerolineales bacterium]